ncbi:MAG: D-amino-acid transaminase [Alphaproteobacteria bacterium]|nr:D-amino-acid transaminase [Alphaproteobacteria bacterium]
MPRIAYVNGRYLPHRDAAVHVEDRGYQFADGVYEVIFVVDGRLVDAPAHLARLHRSCASLRIAMPTSDRALEAIVASVIARNRIGRGIVYIQITRGVARRDHAFPRIASRPALVVTARTHPAPDETAVRSGVAVVTVADQRWRRPDIKSISLLPNVLAKEAAREAGAHEAWLVDDAGVVTEGSSTNAWIVDRDGRVVTHPADTAILDGIVRRTLFRLANEASIVVIERPFRLAEAMGATEAFLTSSTSFVVPVVAIDGSAIGTGRAGPVTLRLRDAYLAHLGRAAAAR